MSYYNTKYASTTIEALEEYARQGSKPVEGVYYQGNYGVDVYVNFSDVFDGKIKVSKALMNKIARRYDALSNEQE